MTENHFYRELRSVVSTGALIIACGSHIAFAQTPAAQVAEPGRSPDADIIVTAQRREQRLQDVPVSISVVSGDALESGNVRTLQDLSNRLPNVRVAAGQSAESINIRGIGSGQNPGFEQSVAVFVDGLYRPRSRAIRSALFDIERVEVLRGPQTTFFGANAIAGALNITTRKPSETLGYDALALYGSDNEYTVEGGVTGGLAEGLSARVAGRFYGIDDYVDNRSAAQRGRLREKTGRFSLHWQPSDSFKSDLRVEGDRMRNTGAYDNELLNCPVATPYAGASNLACGIATAQAGGAAPDGRLDRKSNIVPGLAKNAYYEIGWTNSLEIGTHSLTAVTGYYRNNNEIIQDLIPTGATGPDNAGSLIVHGFDKYHQFSQELRIQSPSGGTFEYLAGAYYQKSDLEAVTYAGYRFLPFGAFVPPALNPSGFTGATQVGGHSILSQNEETISGFASATYRPVEQVRLNVGLRYSSVSKDASRLFEIGSYTGISGPGTFTPAPAVTQQFYVANVFGGSQSNFPTPKRTDKDFMPSAGIQIDATRDLMLYATYAGGFKAGGYGGTNVLEEFGPESVDAFEIGAKGSFIGGRLNYNLALFRANYKDLQEASIVFLPGGTTVSITTNAARAVSQGVEFGVNYRVSPIVTFSADLAYLDSSYKNFPNGACTVFQTLSKPVGCVQDLSGKQRPFSPKYSGNVAASIAIPFDDYRLTFDPSAYFTSKYFQQGNGDSLYVQKGYTKFDLRVGFGAGDGQWTIAAIGRNLSDKQTAGFRSGVPASPGSVIAFPDRGRSFAVQLTLKN